MVFFFFSHYMVLRNYLGQTTKEDIDLFFQVCINLRTHKTESTFFSGLFDRGQGESINHDPTIRKISNDNITAISSISNIHNLGFSKHIARHFLKYQSRFDNGQPLKPRWLYKSHTGRTSTTCQFHPRDWFYWLYMGGFKALAMPFFPIFLLSQIITCFTPLGETSGKLLMFNRLLGKKQWPLKLTWKICNYILKKRYKTNNWLIPVTDIYFYQDYNNPIRVLVRQIEDLK